MPYAPRLLNALAFRSLSLYRDPVCPVPPEDAILIIRVQYSSTVYVRRIATNVTRSVGCKNSRQEVASSYLAFFAEKKKKHGRNKQAVQERPPVVDGVCGMQHACINNDMIVRARYLRELSTISAVMTNINSINTPKISTST